MANGIVDGMKIEFFGRLAMAYEMAAIEGMNDFLNPASNAADFRDQFAAGAYRAFELRRLFPIPDADVQKVLHILHISALAYCGDRWTDLRRWYNENEGAFRIPSVAHKTADIVGGLPMNDVEIDSACRRAVNDGGSSADNDEFHSHRCQAFNQRPEISLFRSWHF